MTHEPPSNADDTADCSALIRNDRSASPGPRAARTSSIDAKTGATSRIWAAASSESRRLRAFMRSEIAEGEGDLRRRDALGRSRSAPKGGSRPRGSTGNSIARSARPARPRRPVRSAWPRRRRGCASDTRIALLARPDLPQRPRENEKQRAFSAGSPDFVALSTASRRRSSPWRSPLFARRNPAARRAIRKLRGRCQAGGPRPGPEARASGPRSRRRSPRA